MSQKNPWPPAPWVLRENRGFQLNMWSFPFLLISQAHLWAVLSALPGDTAVTHGTLMAKELIRRHSKGSNFSKCANHLCTFGQECCDTRAINYIL